MSRFLALMLLLFGSLDTVPAQTPESADIRSFELAPVAPPKPALKYQLLFSDLADQLTGNAALLYLDAILLMGPDAKEKGSQALEAYEANDMTTFHSLAEELKMPNVLDELELAGRRAECDWQPPFRERGAYTLLPHLEPLANGITKVVKVNALRQIEQGKPEDALHTLRLGYELSDKVGREPTVVSSLVSLAILREMNDALARLMNRPESPNLYWALSAIPTRQPMFCRALDCERSFVAPSIPNFMRLRAGEELSADEWRELFDDIWDILGSSSGESRKRLDPTERARPETLQRARQEYARLHRISEAEATKVDALIVLGEFYYGQFVVLFDEQYKLRRLPYPELLSRARAQAASLAKLQEAQPENPLRVYNFEPTVRRFAEADRQLAALVAVEAIRSYAAEHDGKLPARLDEVTETPVPLNPATGTPFEYQINGDTATLSDTQFEPALKYVVRIRK